MRGRKVEMPTWESGQRTFQRGSAFSERANSCSAATPDANVSAPPFWVLFPSATVALSQSLSAAESKNEKRSVIVIKVFLQLWPEIPFWSQESFSFTNLLKLVHCHEIFWFGKLAFPVKNYLIIYFSLWGCSSCFSGTTNRKSQILVWEKFSFLPMSSTSENDL